MQVLVTVPAALIQPNIQPGRVAGVRLDNDIQVAVAVQIADSRFVVVDSTSEQCPDEVPPAVAINDPHASAGLVWVLGSIGPLGQIDG
jgi:hypothetical protein